MVRPETYVPTSTSTPQRIEVLEQGKQYQATCTVCAGRRIGNIKPSAGAARQEARSHRELSARCRTLDGAK